MRALLWIGLGGCLREEETPFPPGVEPWEASTAPAPDEEPGEKYPEEVVFVTGEDDDYLWLHGRGYLHGDVAAAWAALSVPEAAVDRRGVTSYEIESDVESGFDVSFAVHNVVEDIITLEFTNTWRQSVVDGDAEEPRVVAGVWQKTDGVSIIETLRGSVVLRETDERDRTEIELVEHLGAPQTDDVDLLCFNQDLFDNLASLMRGGDLIDVSGACIHE